MFLFYYPFLITFYSGLFLVYLIEWIEWNMTFYSGLMRILMGFNGTNSWDLIGSYVVYIYI